MSGAKALLLLAVATFHSYSHDDDTFLAEAFTNAALDRPLALGLYYLNEMTDLCLFPSLVGSGNVLHR